MIEAHSAPLMLPEGCGLAFILLFFDLSWTESIVQEQSICPTPYPTSPPSLPPRPLIVNVAQIDSNNHIQ